MGLHLKLHDIVLLKRDDFEETVPVNSGNLKAVLQQFVTRPLPLSRERES